MPIVQLKCLNDHDSEVFLHSWHDLGCELRRCEACGETLAPVFSPGTTLTYFGEGAAGQWIHNLGHEPVFITSHQQHKAAMKKAGVTQGNPNSMRGRKGYCAN